MTSLKKLEIVNFKEEHLKMFNLREEDKGRNLKLGKIWAAAGPAYSFFDSEKIVFSGGVVIISVGVGEAWIICDEDIRKYVRELYYYSNLYLEKIKNKYKLWRIQAKARVDWPEASIYLNNLKFLKEGILHKYGPDGSDYYVYGRIW